MAPTTSLQESARLVARQYGYGYGYGNNCDYNGNCYYSPWYSWGRWVLFGVIVFVALLFFFIVACLSSRRRRQRGRQPMYGTGWMSGQHGQAQYYGPNGANISGQNGANGYSGYGGWQNQHQQPGYEQAPPQYSQPTGNSTAGYYGGQQSGIELQQPQNTYAPPTGPPPSKH